MSVDFSKNYYIPNDTVRIMQTFRNYISSSHIYSILVIRLSGLFFIIFLTLCHLVGYVESFLLRSVMALVPFGYICILLPLKEIFIYMKCTIIGGFRLKFTCE